MGKAAGGGVVEKVDARGAVEKRSGWWRSRREVLSIHGENWMRSNVFILSPLATLC